MKVLFVSSGNSANGISPIILNQGTSLQNQGVSVTYFTIKGKGIIGYLKAIPKLRKFIKENNFDIIHAHYSLSAFVATLSGAKPLVVSLMGSDVKAKKYFKFTIKLFNKFSWSKMIVKSEDMKLSLGIKEVEIIPNGVDFERFKPIDGKIALKETGWDNTKKHVLFAANPERYVKNFKLAKDAFDLLNRSDIDLHFLNEVPNVQLPFYFNAADVVLLTSLWEGSPNVIKEAMACNRPIVSTNVGDIETLLKCVDGCYLTYFSPTEIKQKLTLSLEFSATNGHEKISSLQLDSVSIANKIVSVYKKCIESTLLK
jgi:teichuronic acid biosynthesis glycosyltransferase TuaC